MDNSSNVSLSDTSLSYIKSSIERWSIERAKKTRSRQKEELEATNMLNEYQKVILEKQRGNKNLGRKNYSSLLSSPQKSIRGRLARNLSLFCTDHIEMKLCFKSS